MFSRGNCSFECGRYDYVYKHYIGTLPINLSTNVTFRAIKARCIWQLRPKLFKCQHVCAIQAEQFCNVWYITILLWVLHSVQPNSKLEKQTHFTNYYKHILSISLSLICLTRNCMFHGKLNASQIYTVLLRKKLELVVRWSFLSNFSRSVIYSIRISCSSNGNTMLNIYLGKKLHFYIWDLNITDS